MIRAALAGEAAGLAARLTARAATLARAAVEDRRRARIADPSRWRRPHLLWPLF